MLLGPAAFQWLVIRGDTTGDLLIVGVWGAWMFGAALVWSKKGDFDHMDRRFPASALTVFIVTYLALVIGFSLAGV